MHKGSEEEREREKDKERERERERPDSALGRVMPFVWRARQYVVFHYAIAFLFCRISASTFQRRRTR